MKTVVDKDGNFMFTFEGGEINLDDPALVGCTIVDGDGPLVEYQEKLQENADEAAREEAVEHEREHSYLASLEQRIVELENKFK